MRGDVRLVPDDQHAGTNFQLAGRVLSGFTICFRQAQLRADLFDLVAHGQANKMFGDQQLHAFIGEGCGQQNYGPENRHVLGQDDMKDDERLAHSVAAVRFGSASTQNPFATVSR